MVDAVPKTSPFRLCAPIGPPRSRAVLLERAQELAGLSLAEAAERQHLRVPTDMRHAKGFSGQLVERLLGANAGGKPEPDFVRLGVELKTIPLDDAGKPCESTFVTALPLNPTAPPEWEQSAVASKLRAVLWVPIEGHRQRPLAERRIGWPALWLPDEEVWASLREDFELLWGHIALRGLDAVSGQLGRALHLRPKAASSRHRRRAHDALDGFIDAKPLAFYLRRSFTAVVLSKALDSSCDAPC